MKQRSISAVISFLVLSGCGSGFSDYREGGYRARAQLGSECAEQAHALRFRNVEVEPARLRVAVNGKQWSTLQIKQDAMLDFVVPTMGSA